MADDDLHAAVRGLMLVVLNLQTQVGVPQLVIQKHGGITWDNILEARAELERRFPGRRQLADRIQGVDSEYLLRILRDFEGTVQ
jgi:hypothetical protein